MSNELSLKFELNSKKNLAIIFSILISSGLFIRLIFADFNLPIFVDATDYYVYSYKVVTEYNIPKNVLENNDGWSWFLSFFFMFFRETDFLTLSILQKILSITVSTLTIIPLYFFCKRFVSKEFSIIGAALFIFDPRIILNSTLGVTEPLYICLISIALALAFSKNTRHYYFVFFIIALLSTVRYEGLIMIFPISIIFFLRFRITKNSIREFLIAAFIFSIIILIIGTAREEVYGMNGYSSHFIGGIIDYFSSNINENSEGFVNSNNTENFFHSFFFKS